MTAYILLPEATHEVKKHGSRQSMASGIRIFDVQAEGLGPNIENIFLAYRQRKKGTSILSLSAVVELDFMGNIRPSFENDGDDYHDGADRPSAHLSPIQVRPDRVVLDTLSLPGGVRPLGRFRGWSAWLARELVLRSFNHRRYRGYDWPTLTRDERFVLAADYWVRRSASFLRADPPAAAAAGGCRYWGYATPDYPGGYCRLRYCPFCWARSAVENFQTLRRVVEGVGGVWARLCLFDGRVSPRTRLRRLLLSIDPPPAAAVSVSVPVGGGSTQVRVVAVGNGRCPEGARLLSVAPRLPFLCSRWFRYPRQWDTTTVALGWGRAAALSRRFHMFQLHGACRADWRPGGRFNWADSEGRS